MTFLAIVMFGNIFVSLPQAKKKLSQVVEVVFFNANDRE